MRDVVTSFGLVLPENSTGGSRADTTSLLPSGDLSLKGMPESTKFGPSLLPRFGHQRNRPPLIDEGSPRRRDLLSRTNPQEI